MDRDLINNLPNELLLAVFRSTPGISKDRQTTLIKIAQTCPRFKPIAEEALLESPVVHPYKIPFVTSTILRCSQGLTWRTKTLEICAVKEGDVKPASDLDHKDFSFCYRFFDSEACSAVIDDESKCVWKEDLLAGYHSAYFAILFSLFPNLTTLHLGPTNISYYSFLRDIVKPNRPLHSLPNLPAAWRESPTYLDCVFNSLVPRITSIDLPTNVALDFTKGKSPPDLTISTQLHTVTDFKSLRHIVLPGTIDTFSASRFTHLLPPSIETIVFMDVDQRTQVVRHIIEAAIQVKPRYSAFHRTEIYLLRLDKQGPKKWDLLIEKAMNAGVEVKVYFRILDVPPPSFESRRKDQTWRYTEKEREALEMERYVEAQVRVPMVDSCELNAGSGGQETDTCGTQRPE